MGKQNIDDRLRLGSFSDMFGDLLETPAGLLVTAKSAEPLIKSEAKRLAAAQQSQTPFLFSRNAMFMNMLYHGARAKTIGTPSFETLYVAAKKSFVDAILIRARVNQFKMVWQKSVAGKQVGFKVVHDQHDDPKFKPTDDVLRRCKEMEELISNPTPQKYKAFYPYETVLHESGIKDLISRLVRSELIIDRKCIFRGKRRDNKGYAFFHWVPGASIFPVHEGLRRWEEEHSIDGEKRRRRGFVTPQLVDAASAATGFDLANMDYVQIDRTGTICAAFTAEEICIHISNPSDEMDCQGFGESPLELSLDVTQTVLKAWQYNNSLFDTNYPENILMVSGNYDKAGLEAFKLQLTADTGRGGNQRMPIIAGEPGADIKDLDMKSFKMRDAPKDMLFDQLFRMMVAVKAAAYGAHPSIINFQVDSGSGGGSMFGHNPVDEIEFSKEHGFLPSLMDMVSWLTRIIIKPQYDDLKLIIEGLDDENEKEKQEIFLNKIKTYETRNEARMADGLEPGGFWLSKEDLDKLKPEDEDYIRYWDNAMNYPADAPVATYITTLSSKKQQEAMAQQQMQQPGDQQEQDSGAEGMQPPDDGSPWASDSYQQQDPGAAMAKSRDEKRDVKYLRISID